MNWLDEKKVNAVDHKILVHGGIQLYHRNEFLKSDEEWLKNAGYLIYTLDFSEIKSLEEFHEAASVNFKFPGWYGHNLDAFNDVIHYLDIEDEPGIVFVFLHYDKFASQFPEKAHFILDKISVASRRYLIHGKRFIALVQTDNPHLDFPAIDLCYVRWSFKDMKAAIDERMEKNKT